jgi:hypothetical protein
VGPRNKLLDYRYESVPRSVMGDFQSWQDSHSAAGYRKQAKEIRLVADRMSNFEAKEALLKIAAGYDHLAERQSKAER